MFLWICFFFFKQKTAYEMRISDWSSDVCSSDLLLIGLMALFAIGNGMSALSPDYATMLLFRFLSGLPHGAYFGVAALVAASLVPGDRRALAVARVMTGLTVATVIGVPAANWMGQALGWRWEIGRAHV